MPALVAVTAVTALAAPARQAVPEAARETSAPGVSAAVSCNDEFNSLGVELLSCISKEDLSSNPADHGEFNQAADIWGYVSPSCREYAIMGLHAGFVFVEVTDPRNPAIVGYIDGPSSTWRDMKTYQQHAYMVIDGSGLGLLVVDLTEIDDGVVTLVKTSNDRTFFTAHNIALNVASGYAYTIGSNIDAGGVTPWDLSDPANPVALPGWAETWLHDAQVVTYTEGDFAGREIAYGFATGNGLKVVDVTDKENMFTLASRTYPDLGYCHQGWLSEDRHYLFIDDEFDESESSGPDTSTTYVFDVSNPADPQFLTSYTNGIESIDHNLMTRGRFVFSANYTSGLRIFDACDILNVVEVGYFDTHPEVDEANWNFDGAWGVFTDFPSRIVIVSDRDRGLFVFDTSEAEATPPPLPECQNEEPCGNGNVDTCETCDIAIPDGDPGACPTSCDSKNPCAIGTLVNMGSCVAACDYKEIVTPTNDDGCCPQGANANNDNDCEPICGNGTVEEGEACDISIPDGNPGACPMACDSQDPCVIGTLVNIGSCTADCNFEDITTPVNDDGCCPQDAEPSNDNDCPCNGNASCDDGDACTFDLCAGAACTHVEAPFGDVAGDGGICAPDQTVGLVDILGVLNAFQGIYSDGCERYNMDLADCTPDAVIDLFDILAVLDAFQGTSPCCK